MLSHVTILQEHYHALSQAVPSAREGTESQCSQFMDEMYMYFFSILSKIYLFIYF